jgi:hypothetical protein
MGGDTDPRADVLLAVAALDRVLDYVFLGQRVIRERESVQGNAQANEIDPFAEE